ncbi:hypothetical protein P43SY_000638 [Pythium insidiosum]|uniref:CCT domain-containing protein n=1 Tax=Pythium insidiosum TaxID=114742 RepID=A0AAD5QAH5_PYTIN|nr:hypothetical protein P43SY_000638 [Pythium insidiosum]
MSESPLLRGPEERGDEKLLPLRDLVSAAGGGLLELLQRVQRREDHAPGAEDLQMSRAQLSSQELFLSVVLEWQRSQEPAFRAVRDEMPYASSAASSYASSDEDVDDSSRRQPGGRAGDKSPDDVSPTSVHNVPGELTPLRLDAISSFGGKRIGVYTPRARQELLQKYMAKRARRLSQNKVRYGVRKTLANARPRVKGRFVKTEQPLTAAIVHAMSTSDQ